MLATPREGQNSQFSFSCHPTRGSQQFSQFFLPSHARGDLMVPIGVATATRCRGGIARSFRSPESPLSLAYATQCCAIGEVRSHRPLPNGCSPGCMDAVRGFRSELLLIPTPIHQLRTVHGCAQPPPEHGLCPPVGRPELGGWRAGTQALRRPSIYRAMIHGCQVRHRTAKSASPPASLPEVRHSPPKSATTNNNRHNKNNNNDNNKNDRNNMSNTKNNNNKNNNDDDNNGNANDDNDNDDDNDNNNSNNDDDDVQ
eukprot:gene8424-biopygen10150